MSVTVSCFKETMSSTSSVNHLVMNAKERKTNKEQPDEHKNRDTGMHGIVMTNHDQGKTTSTSLWRLCEIFVAETVATGMLMFFGCMSQIAWKDDTPVHPWQGAVVFSVLVATIIQIFGHISAAHLNPAVSVCFLLLGHITPVMCLVYIVAECIGATLGFGLLRYITPCDILELTSKLVSENVCSTFPHPSLTLLQALASEFFATSCVILVVCGFCDPRNPNTGETNSLKFAATILALSLTVGPYTGASMNPARSLGPAIWNGSWEKHWIYWVAPMLSAVVVTYFYQMMFVRARTLIEQVEDLPLTNVQVKVQKQDVKERK